MATCTEMVHCVYYSFQTLHFLKIDDRTVSIQSATSLRSVADQSATDRDWSATIPVMKKSSCSGCNQNQSPKGGTAVASSVGQGL